MDNEETKDRRGAQRVTRETGVYDINASMPWYRREVFRHDLRFIRNGRCGLYELFADGREAPICTGKQITARFQAPILDNGYSYAKARERCCVKWGRRNRHAAQEDHHTRAELPSFGGLDLRFGATR